MQKTEIRVERLDRSRLALIGGLCKLDVQVLERFGWLR